MSYVVPNGSVKILQNVPIESNYEHSLYFANAGTQYSYFNSKVKGVGYSFSDMSHIRVTTPGRKIRVPININNLYDCNYLIIQNNGNAGKVFYCFIDNVEYVNEGVSEISYSIDVIQTWMFDYSSGGVLNRECLVEREHVRNDTVGANIIDEGLNTGDLLSGLSYSDPNFANPKLVLIATGDLDAMGAIKPASGKFYNGTFHQIDLGIYSIDSLNISATIDAITNKLNEMSIFQNTDTIVNFLMMPNAFIHTGTTAYVTSVEDASVGTLSLPNGFTATQGSYTPKNNKLLTYPYTFFTVDNHEGSIEEFKFELFYGRPKFDEYCDFSPQPSVMILPVGYNQSDDAYAEDYEMTKALKISNFPVCSWAVNDLPAKFVQAGIGAVIGAMSRGVFINSPGASWTANNNPLGYMSAGDVPLLEQSKQMQTYQRQSPEIHYNEDVNIPGSKIGFRLKPAGAVALGVISRSLLNTHMHSFTGHGNILQPAGMFGFEFRQKYLRPEIAKMIDDYFTMYGYKVNALKYPNIHNRTKWTYIKTSGCSVAGTIPNEDADRICDIFDNGITFWVNASEVGNYSLTNNTLSYGLSLNDNEQTETQETNPISEG